MIPARFVLGLILTLIIRALLLAGMIACAIYIGQMNGEPAAIAVWAAAALALCGIGAACIASQPPETPTLLGRIGGTVVRWGYVVGRGRLTGAVLVSWIIWMILGAAAIDITLHRDSLQRILIVLSWTIDAMLLFYSVGVASTKFAGRWPTGLLQIGGILVAMIVISGVLWFGVHNDWSRRTALLIAGGPPAVIGGVYGLFILAMVVFGRNARWN